MLLVLAFAGCTPYVPPARTPVTAANEWEEAGRRALRDLPTVTPTHRDHVRFSARSSARGYRVHMLRGQTLTITFDDRNTPVLTEIFEEIGPGDPIFRLVHASAPRTSRIVFEARTDGPHVVRLRPELSGRSDVRVTLIMAAALTFPVLGRTTRAINSYFGEARDGGKRDHEGIDIFAPSGTSVVAVAPGVITTVNTTSLGGNVVWQHDPVRNVTYYYAHLKSQDVKRGDRVKAGDLIGTVGNTGNARTTPPHLHFAVYRPGRIAIDPVPFLYNPDALAEGGRRTSSKGSD